MFYIYVYIYLGNMILEPVRKNDKKILTHTFPPNVNTGDTLFFSLSVKILTVQKIVFAEKSH